MAEAYIRGLERRLEEGKSVDINSVASFFVSRVDTEVDKRFEGADHDELLGKAGIANARAAYQRYEDIFLGERFAALQSAGAAVQRLLWASTGVKNPAYRDVMYVEELVGRTRSTRCRWPRAGQRRPRRTRSHRPATARETRRRS